MESVSSLTRFLSTPDLSHAVEFDQKENEKKMKKESLSGISTVVFKLKLSVQFYCYNLLLFDKTKFVKLIQSRDLVFK
jgi:hypothetical protein